mgnify:CR=1 FL=1
MRLRVEPFNVGDFIHVFNRGNKKAEIFREEADKWHFLKILRYFNNRENTSYILKRIAQEKGFDPKHPFKFEEKNKTPLVKILSYCLRDNHFHLLLKEIIKGGVSLFMKKLGDAYTIYFNQKYQEIGRLFQGGYRGKTLRGDQKLLQYMDAYIQVFNAFEEYPGGIERALQEFDRAVDFVLANPFSSLGESFGKRNLKIIERDILEKVFPSFKVYKEFLKDALLVRNIRTILGKLTIE